MTQENKIKLPDFKTLRENTGITLREVEKETGISNAYLSQLENGKIKKPSYEIVMTLVNFYTSCEQKGLHYKWQQLMSIVEKDMQKFDQEQKVKAGKALQDLANIFFDSSNDKTPSK